MMPSVINGKNCAGLAERINEGNKLGNMGELISASLLDQQTNA